MGHRRRGRTYRDGRGPGELPCPCCGYRTLHEGPGDYDLCPVCFWEDAGDQLRWPTLADGPNGISLIDAQRNFVESGACHADHRGQVRKPKPDEAREPGWRPFDPGLDDFESDPEDPRNLPWPTGEELYWWRPTYFRLPENQRPGPAPRRPPANEAERMMARIIEVAPETEAIDVEMRSRWEEPAPLAFCFELAPFVVEAVHRGDIDVASRIVNELNAGLASGDDFAATCVCVGFLELYLESGCATGSDFVDTWPAEIHTEMLQQVAFQARARQGVDGIAGVGEHGMPWQVPLRWRIRHPILWWKMRHGGVHLVG